MARLEDHRRGAGSLITSPTGRLVVRGITRYSAPVSEAVSRTRSRDGGRRVTTLSAGGGAPRQWVSLREHLIHGSGRERGVRLQLQHRVTQCRMLEFVGQ